MSVLDEPFSAGEDRAKLSEVRSLCVAQAYFELSAR